MRKLLKVIGGVVGAAAVVGIAGVGVYLASGSTPSFIADSLAGKTCGLPREDVLYIGWNPVMRATYSDGSSEEVRYQPLGLMAKFNPADKTGLNPVMVMDMRDVFYYQDGVFSSVGKGVYDFSLVDVPSQDESLVFLDASHLIGQIFEYDGRKGSTTFGFCWEGGFLYGPKVDDLEPGVNVLSLSSGEDGLEVSVSHGSMPYCATDSEVSE